MLNLREEKECKISSQQRYDIINFALEAANEGGFVNQFVFERALYLYAAIALLDDTEELKFETLNNPLISWDKSVNDGTIETLIQEYGKDLNYLAEDAASVVEDYAEYQVSVRALLTTMQGVTGDLMKTTAEEYEKFAKEHDLAKIIDLADNWGMSNQVKVYPADSLFS